MKKILSIALLCSSLTAQLYAVDVENGYRATLTEGREWIYKELLPDYESMTEEQINNGEVPYTTSFHSLLVGKTVLFEGKECHEILHRKDDAEQLFGYAYEEGGKIFFYPLYADDVEGFSQPISYKKNEWQLLYDFSATLGVSSEMVWLWSSFCLAEKDIISVDGYQYTRQIWKSEDNSINLIVEGIGCETGFLYIENITDNGASTQFVECRDKGQCIFTKENFNATSSINDFSETLNQPNTMSSEYYDLQGRRLSSQPQHGGVYIQNGKKILNDHRTVP
ncbi:MAG: hypothetical protein IJ559_00800 [Prevotella sp.]|nr:hypothetical protein [Prevotella sp.]